MTLTRYWTKVRELVWTAGPVGVVVLLAFWGAAQFVAPAPPNEVVIAAASKGSPYYEAAERYRQVLAQSGINTRILETAGSLANLELIKNPASGVSAAFIQGGIASSKNAPNVLSLGRVLYEPIWVFCHNSAKITLLSSLVGKRVLIGPTGSATAVLATRLLAASGVTAQTATFINMELPAYVAAFEAGQADAGVLVLAAEAKTIKRLLNNTQVSLLDIVRVDAYTQRFPFLSRLELKQGVVDLARNIPPTDVRLLATTAALVVRDDLHPALANLLTQAAIAVHRPPSLNSDGESGFFQRAEMFPMAEDQEFPLSPEAERVYRSGSPFLQRFLPFWLAIWADRLMVLLLPIIGVLLPAIHFAPSLYVWRIRQRMIHWYRELKKVEDAVDANPCSERVAKAIRDLDLIDRAINRLPIPAAFANQLYDLRDHAELARRRLAAMAMTTGATSEVKPRKPASTS